MGLIYILYAVYGFALGVAIGFVIASSILLRNIEFRLYDIHYRLKEVTRTINKLMGIHEESRRGD